MSVDTARLKIVLYPDPVLRRPCDPVEEVTDEIRQVASRMLQLMREAPGVGLAAPQVGLSCRLFVANHSGDPEDDCVFINPEISNLSKETDEREEGCLSLPDVRGLIRRPSAIKISALDRDGQPFGRTSDDLPSRIWQHELDHLDGVLIINRMSQIDRLANRRGLKELEAAFEKTGA